MPRYLIGLEQANPLRNVMEAAAYVVDADKYDIKESFVTFTKDDRAILSIPVSAVGVIAKLGENNKKPFDPLPSS